MKAIGRFQLRYNHIRLLRSHVEQFGDLEIGAHYYVGEFLGMERLGGVKANPLKPRRRLSPITDAVPAPDVPIRVLERRYAAASSLEEKSDLWRKLQQMKKNRILLDAIVDSIARHVATASAEELTDSDLSEKRPIRNYVCFERVVSHFSRTCAPFSLNDYALRKVQIFVNLCEKGAATESIYKAITDACSRREPLQGIH